MIYAAMIFLGFMVGSVLTLAHFRTCMRKWVKHYRVIGDGVTVKALKRVLHDLTGG